MDKQQSCLTPSHRLLAVWICCLKLPAVELQLLFMGFAVVSSGSASTVTSTWATFSIALFVRQSIVDTNLFVAVFSVIGLSSRKISVQALMTNAGELVGRGWRINEWIVGIVRRQFQYFLRESNIRLWEQWHKRLRYEPPFQGRPNPTL